MKKIFFDSKKFFQKTERKFSDPPFYFSLFEFKTDEKPFREDGMERGSKRSKNFSTTLEPVSALYRQ